LENKDKPKNNPSQSKESHGKLFLAGAFTSLAVVVAFVIFLLKKKKKVSKKRI